MKKLLLLLSIVYAPTITASIVSPFTLDFSTFGGPAALQGTTLAGGLNFPYGFARLPDGSLLYGQSLPTSAVGLYYGNGPATTGSVWMQAAQPGGTFAAPQKIIDGLAGVVTDVRTFADGTILVDSGNGNPNNRTMSFFSSTGQPKGALAFTYPGGGWEHSTGMSLVQQNSDGSANIFFILGSQDDNHKTNSTVSVTGAGLSPTTINGDSIYRVTVTTAGNAVQVIAPPIQVATGFRNAYGLALDSLGNVFAADNGIDGAHLHDQLAADALYRIPTSQIGASVFDAGFPNSYTDFTTGQQVQGDPNAASPIVAFRPDPQSSEGVAGLAFVVPGELGTGASGGVLAAFHGVFDAGGSDNYDNALELYDFASGTLTPVLNAGTAGMGHIDSVYVQDNRIFLSDFSQNGEVNSLAGVGQGAVYEFDYPASIPEPGTWAGAAAALLLFLGVKRNRLSMAQRLTTTRPTYPHETHAPSAWSRQTEI